DVREDGRLNEKSTRQFRAGRSLPAIDQLSTLLLSNSDVALDLVLLLLEGNRAHLCLHLQRIAQLDGACTFGQLANQFIVELGLNEEPGTCDTGLTTGCEDSRNHSVDNPFIRVSED